MAPVNRADTAVNLELPGAWNSGLGPAPTSSDIATWGSPNITTNISRNLGASVSWLGIEFLSTQTANISIGLNNVTLTLGSGGIDLSLSSANFTMSANTLVSLGADQSWKVGAGRTITMNSVVSSVATNRILTKTDPGTLALSLTNTWGGAGGGFVASGGLTTLGNNGALGSASNTVTVNSGAAIQIPGAVAAPQQTVWSASGSGIAASYGAIHFASAFGATRTITLKAQNTVLSFRNAVAFTGKLALDTGAGINTITLNGEIAGAAADGSYTATSQSDYVGAVSISGLKLDGTTASGIKYSIGSAASASDAKTSGGGALGDNANNVTIGTTGGIASNSANGTFNRNYTFTARGARQAQALGQFKAVSGISTTTFATGTLTFSGGTSDYVHFAGPNNNNAIIKLNGTITGGANLDIGSPNGYTTDATAELGTSLVSTGWDETATLTVNNIRYGSSLANANPIVFIPGSIIDNVSGGPLTVRHSAYSHIGVNSLRFDGTNPLIMTGPVGAEANWTSSPRIWNVQASTLTLAFNFTGSGGFEKFASGTGTLVLSGNNTGFTSFAWGTGPLCLNSAGAAGVGAVTLSTPSGGLLDNTSGSPVVLTATGAWAWNANFIWGGTGDLTRPSSVSYTTARTVSFTVGGTKTLKIASGQSSAGSVALNVGGGVTGTRSRLHIEGASASIATTSSVTAGYLKAGNAASLGAVGTTTAWTVSDRGAIELDGGITTPGTKNGTFTGGGPDNNDGALRATTSGTNKWQGAISIPSTAGARFTAADGATLTLDPTGSPAYSGLQGPTGSSCPVYFDAGISSTVNQDRILANTIGIVYCGNNGSSSGRVVLSKANQHTGILDCVSGTTSLTNQNAAGPAGGAGATVRATARLAVEVATTYKATFPGTTTLGSSTNPLAVRAKFRIGA
jgi:hypothetical protein